MFKNLTKKRLTVLLVSLSLVLVAGVGVTLALIIDSSGPVDNTFEPSHVSCAVVENGTAYETGMVEVASKENVTIQNTGDTDAYIRAAIIVNWKKADGTVWAQAPASKDYTLAIGGDWDLGTDGYYYYKSSVAPKDLTTALITSATQVNSAPEEGYFLSIEIVASAIQSSLAGNAQGAWSAAAETGSN